MANGFDIPVIAHDAPTTRSRRVTWRRILQRDAAILFAAMIALELALRLVAPRYSQNLYDHEFTGSKPLALNSQGYRGSLVLAEKAPGELRILALGDSVTFGTGMNAAEIWPTRLGQILATRNSRPVTVLNGALPGADIKQLSFATRQQWRQARPDAIVLLVSPNMVSLAWHHRDDAPCMPRNGFADFDSGSSPFGRAKVRVNRAVKSMCAPSFLSLNVQRLAYWVGIARHDIYPAPLKSPWLAYGPIQYVIHGDVPNKAWEAMAVDLESVRDAAEEMHVPLILAFAPSRFWLTGDWFDNEKCVPVDRLTIDAPWRFSQLCRTMNLPCADLTGALRAERIRREEAPPSLYIPFDFTHFDAVGHRVVAEVIADTVAPELPSRR